MLWSFFRSNHRRCSLKKLLPKISGLKPETLSRNFLEHVFVEHLWVTGPCLFNAIMINFERIKLARSFMKMI